MINHSLRRRRVMIEVILNGSCRAVEEHENWLEIAHKDPPRTSGVFLKLCVTWIHSLQRLSSSSSLPPWSWPLILINTLAKTWTAAAAADGETSKTAETRWWRKITASSPFSRFTDQVHLALDCLQTKIIYRTSWIASLFPIVRIDGLLIEINVQCCLELMLKLLLHGNNYTQTLWPKVIW